MWSKKHPVPYDCVKCTGRNEILRQISEQGYYDPNLTTKAGTVVMTGDRNTYYTGITEKSNPESYPAVPQHGYFESPEGAYSNMKNIVKSAWHDDVVAAIKEAEVKEVRVTDPVTGGEKGQKLARFSLIPREFLWALAEHYGLGARKYDDRNWERGYKWSLSVDALERHLNQWILGEDKDPETGSHHLIAVAWHACALFIYQLRGLGTDDIRLKPNPQPSDTTQ